MKTITLTQFLASYSNVEFRVRYWRAPDDIHEAICICPKDLEPADCHALGRTPEEALTRLFAFMQADGRRAKTISR